MITCSNTAQCGLLEKRALLVVDGAKLERLSVIHNNNHLALCDEEVHIKDLIQPSPPRRPENNAGIKSHGSDIGPRSAEGRKAQVRYDGSRDF